MKAKYSQASITLRTDQKKGLSLIAALDGSNRSAVIRRAVDDQLGDRIKKNHQKNERVG